MAVVEVVVEMLSVASSIEKFANSFIQFPLCASPKRRQASRHKIVNPVT